MNREFAFFLPASVSCRQGLGTRTKPSLYLQKLGILSPSYLYEAEIPLAQNTVTLTYCSLKSQFSFISTDQKSSEDGIELEKSVKGNCTLPSG
jgi:hypothetical protein